MKNKIKKINIPSEKASESKKPFLKGSFILQKYPGKGGWTYLSLPKQEDLPKTPFGTRYVKGKIDQVGILGLSIWSTKSGSLFFPVKAALRKELGKKEGDTVTITLYHDNNELVVPKEFRMLLKEEPLAAKKFRSLTPGRQRELVNWVEKAKGMETRINRMAQVLKTLAVD
jgi:hypothetical protein